MRFSQKEAKSLLGEKAYQQAQAQIKASKKSSAGKKTPAQAAIDKIGRQAKLQANQKIEDKLVSYFEKVFGDTYVIETQSKLVPERKFSVDVYIPELRLAGELDGWEFHGKHKEGFKRDRIKDRLLMLEGIDVVRFYGSEIAKIRTPAQEEIILTELKNIRIARERMFNFAAQTYLNIENSTLSP